MTRTTSLISLCLLALVVVASADVLDPFPATSRVLKAQKKDSSSDSSASKGSKDKLTKAPSADKSGKSASAGKSSKAPSADKTTKSGSKSSSSSKSAKQIKNAGVVVENGDDGKGKGKGKGSKGKGKGSKSVKGSSKSGKSMDPLPKGPTGAATEDGEIDTDPTTLPGTDPTTIPDPDSEPDVPDTGNSAGGRNLNSGSLMKRRQL